MAVLPPAVMLGLKNKIIETFNNEKWMDLGVLTDCSDLINQHPRLLRSMSWGDEDYGGNVTSVLISMLGRNPANAGIVQSFVETGHASVTNISSETLPGPTIIFQPSVFRIPDAPMDPKLVAVMMPFDRAFDDVYVSIGLAAASAGLTCQRASDIWEHSALIQDIFSLIYRSAVVICDFSGRNPNVFYEAGIAHTLGRHLVPITQSGADIPFDLQQHRYLAYLNNQEGRSKMSGKLQERLEFLTKSSWS